MLGITDFAVLGPSKFIPKRRFLRRSHETQARQISQVTNRVIMASKGWLGRVFSPPLLQVAHKARENKEDQTLHEIHRRLSNTIVSSTSVPEASPGQPLAADSPPEQYLEKPSNSDVFMLEGIGRLQLDAMDEKYSEFPQQEPPAACDTIRGITIPVTEDGQMITDETNSMDVSQNRSGRRQPRTTHVNSKGHPASTSGQRQPTRSNTEPTGIAYKVEKRPPKRRSTEPNGDDPDHTRKRNKQSSNDTPLRFACPYFKHDRVKHLDCLHFQLSRVKDVKQHIFRKHQFHCPRCFKIFPDNMKCEKHIDNRECQPGVHSEETAIRDSISEVQKKELSSRTNSGRDETKQWFAVWDVLFKEEERPDSPLLGSEVAEMIEVVRELWAKNGPGIISRLSANSTIDFGIAALAAPSPSSCPTTSNNMPSANLDANPVYQTSHTMDSLLTELAHASTHSQSTSAAPSCRNNDEASYSGNNSGADAVYTVDPIQEDEADISFAEHPSWTSFPQDPMVTDIEGICPTMTPSADIWPIQTQGFEDQGLAHTYFEPAEQIAIDPTLTMGDPTSNSSGEFHFVSLADLSFADVSFGTVKEA